MYTDSEPKNSDDYDEETNELVNSMIKSTVFEHVGSYLNSGVNLMKAIVQLKIFLVWLAQHLIAML